MRASSVTVNDFNGAIHFTIDLKRGFNIISGENGSGKTRLLQTLKSAASVRTFESEPYDPSRVFAINPKRNSQRRELQQIMQQMRAENRSYQNFSSEAINKHFENGGYDNYSSFGEVFFYYFDKIDRTGGDRISAMHAVAEEFNGVIESIFRGYCITAEWDQANGNPSPIVKKRGTAIPLTGLSCGEAELFSLVLNLYALREQFDIFLIDEPETHLNWHLEKLLFRYLKKFAETYDKQLIIATHSRIVVDAEFKESAQFLFWEGGAVQVSEQLPRDQREKLFDDAIQSLRIGGFGCLTIFCEDTAHFAYLDALLGALKIDDYRISECGNSSNVKSLYRSSMSDGHWDKSIFIVDGDGQGMWKEGGRNFIQLPVYCAENYALRLRTISVMTRKSEEELRSKLVELLKGRKGALFQKSKSLIFLVDMLEEHHLTQDRLDQLDGSEIFEEFINWLSFDDAKSFWTALFNHCAGDKELLDSIVEVKLLDAIVKIVKGE